MPAGATSLRASAPLAPASRCISCPLAASCSRRSSSANTRSGSTSSASPSFWRASRSRRASKLQRLPVARELQVAAAHLFPVPESAHRPFPVDRADARSRIELLVVHQRLEAEIVDLHRDRIGHTCAGRLPPAQRPHRYARRRVMDAAFLRAHLECHQRLPVEKVDAAPVPADRLRREIGARPFVVEPCGPCDLASVHPARNREVRLAVVVARLLSPVALAAETPLALQHRLPCRQ